MKSNDQGAYMEDRSVELYQQREEAFFFGKKVRVRSENCFWYRGWVTGHLYKNKLYFFQDSEDLIKNYIKLI